MVIFFNSWSRTKNINNNVISVEPYRFKIVGVDNSSKLHRHLNQIYTSSKTLNTMVDFYDNTIEIHTYEEIILNKPMKFDEMYKILDSYNLGIDKVTPIGSDMLRKMLYNLAYFVKSFVILDITDFVLLIVSGFIMYALTITSLNL